MAKRLSNEEFLKRVEDTFPNYTILTSYKNKRTNIEVKCPNINHKSYEVLPLEFLKSTGCKLCISELSRKQYENSLLTFLEKYFPNYTLLSQYVKDTDKVLVSCGVAEHPDFYITPRSLKSGSGCLKCAGKCPVDAKNDFFQKLKDANYTLLGEYISAGRDVYIRCDKGHQYKVDSRGFRKGQRCSTCNGNSSIIGEIRFEQKIRAAGFKILGNYKSKRHKVKVECANGHIQQIFPSVVKSDKYKCRYCVNRFYGFDNTRPANLYLQILTRSGDDKCFKYGITNRPAEKRMHEQELVSEYNHKLVYVLHHKDGALIEYLEREISKHFKIPYLTKEDLTNGYRETISFDEGIEVIGMIKVFEENYPELEVVFIDTSYP